MIARLGALTALMIAAPVAAQSSAVAQAKVFMASYAKDLIAGNRSGLAARYSADGAYTLGFDAKALRSPSDLHSVYASKAWVKPASFAWRDLSYEALGPEAVIVTGGFEWTESAGKPPALFAYTALLRRESGGWRIRLEHENPLAPPK